MKNFFRLLKEARLPWGRCALYIILSLAVSSATAGLPQVAGDIMDGNIFNEKLIRTYVWVTIASGIISIGLAVFQGWVTNVTDRNLQQIISRKLIHLPMARYQEMNPSSLISRVTVDTSQVSYLVFYLIQMFAMIYTLLLALVIVWNMAHSLCLYLIIIVPWGIGVCITTGRLVSRANDERQGAYAKLTNYVAERLFNIKLIKSHCTENQETDRGQTQTAALYARDKALAKLQILIQPLEYSVASFCKLILLVYGGYLSGKGVIGGDDLVTLVLYMEIIPVYIVQPIMCYETIKEVQGMTTEAGRIIAMPDEQMRSKKSFALADADISFRDVSFRYGKDYILDHVSFTIPKGKVTAIVGPSGAGKTTILKLLERFYEPTDGTIFFGDCPVSDIHLDEWREAFGYIQQNSPLLSGTLRTNIAFGLTEVPDDETIIQVLESAGAGEFVRELPDGLDTDVGESGCRLSGGQRQRAAIGRTVVKSPDFLLLDETTSSLDAHTAALVQESLKTIMNGRTSVVVSHNMKEIRDADHIIVMNRGRVSGSGTHEELYGTNKIYTTFCDLQNKKRS
jgi:ATP-binding cassette, subfamily B, bacterial AbcA/BmrA